MPMPVSPLLFIPHLCATVYSLHPSAWDAFVPFPASPSMPATTQLPVYPSPYLPHPFPCSACLHNPACPTMPLLPVPQPSPLPPPTHYTCPPVVCFPTHVGAPLPNLPPPPYAYAPCPPLCQEDFWPREGGHTLVTGGGGEICSCLPAGPISCHDPITTVCPCLPTPPCLFCNCITPTPTTGGLFGGPSLPACPTLALCPSLTCPTTAMHFYYFIMGRREGGALLPGGGGGGHSHNTPPPSYLPACPCLLPLPATCHLPYRRRGENGRMEGAFRASLPHTYLYHSPLLYISTIPSQTLLLLGPTTCCQFPTPPPCYAAFYPTTLPYPTLPSPLPTWMMIGLWR